MNRRQSHGKRSTVQRIRDLELEREALDLRLAGQTYRGIADEQRCSVATAHDRVNRALERLVPVDNAEVLRQIEAERLDAIGARLLHAVGRASRDPEQVDIDGLVKAATAYTGLAKRKASLLGLDAPVRHNVKVSSDVDAQIEQLVAELAGESDPEETPVES